MITMDNIACFFTCSKPYCSLCMFVYSITGQCHRFQRFQPKVPPTKQPPLLELPWITNHTPPPWERHLDRPEGSNHSVWKTGECKIILISSILFYTSFEAHEIFIVFIEQYSSYIKETSMLHFNCWKRGSCFFFPKWLVSNLILLLYLQYVKQAYTPPKPF